MPEKEKIKKVCLLTGSSGTLGNAICTSLSKNFDIVGIFKTNHPQWPSQMQEFIDPFHPKKKFIENKNKIFAIQADLTVDAEINRVVELTLAHHGRIDILINAAALYSMSPMIDTDQLLHSIEKQFYLNTILPLKLSINIARNFWRDKCAENETNNRNIINISSTSGTTLYPDLGQSVYSASKAALNQLTLHIASEFKHIGIRANAIAPNAFPRMVSMERIMTSLVSFINGRQTGKIQVIEKEKEYFL
jgi:NAD(P)-dependent dehydrogenase (short-subunit alcohol dehydrogenase family)